MTTTSISFHLRPSAKEGRHPGKLFIRIIRARKARHISREYTLYSDEWDIKNKKIIPPTDGNTQRIEVLSHIDESMKNDQKRLWEIVTHLEREGDYTATDVAERFMESLNSNTVRGYAEIVAARLRERGQERTAQAYCSAARSLIRFNGEREVLLWEINAPLIAEYEHNLICKGLKMNTVSFYLRNLRALYFRAVNEMVIPAQPANPFAGMHTGVYETRRRALDGGQLQSLAGLEKSLLELMNALASPESSGEPTMAEMKIEEQKITEEYRRAVSLYDSHQFFMFCYHARGMSFVDMAHLKWSDIGTEILSYRRRKTGGILEVKVTEPMRKILSYFAGRTKESEYVFSVIDSRKVHVHRQYATGLKRQNRSLKTLARMAGIPEPLSTHATRHTWATLAKRMNFPVEVIGEALGHRDVKTTSIYLASFDRSTMDELSMRLSEAAKVA